MAGRLEGKVAIVTGGASGIGRASAELFAEEGANVVVADLRDGMETVAAVRERGREAIFIETDTSDEAACETLAKDAGAAFGGIDVLLAAAGISNWRYLDPEGLAPHEQPDPAATHLLNAPVEAWQKVLDVNLTGVMLSARAVARRMVAAGNGGAIVNVASIMAKVPLQGVGPYCVSKAGVWMLTKVLALELAPHGIRVNAIGPGFIETPMTAGIDEADTGAWAMRLTPMRRMGRPAEVAKTALFLACADSSFYTGAMLHPHGGVFTD